MKTQLELLLMPHGEMPIPPNIVGVKKEVDYVVAPGMWIQQDQLYSEVGSVVIRDGQYFARMKEVVIITEDGFDDRINGYYCSQGWTRFNP